MYAPISRAFSFVQTQAVPNSFQNILFSSLPESQMGRHPSTGRLFLRHGVVTEAQTLAKCTLDNKRTYNRPCWDECQKYIGRGNPSTGDC